MPRSSERNLLITLDEAWSINSVWHGNCIFCMGRSAWGFQNIFKEKFIKPKFQEQILKCFGNSRSKIASAYDNKFPLNFRKKLYGENYFL